jgi:hypothetical protein
MFVTYYNLPGKTSAQVALGVREMGMGSGGKQCRRGRWHGKDSFGGESGEVDVLMAGSVMVGGWL